MAKSVFVVIISNKGLVNKLKIPVAASLFLFRSLSLASLVVPFPLWADKRVLVTCVRSPLFRSSCLGALAGGWRDCNPAQDCHHAFGSGLVQFRPRQSWRHFVRILLLGDGLVHIRPRRSWHYWFRSCCCCD